MLFPGDLIPRGGGRIGTPPRREAAPGRTRGTCYWPEGGGRTRPRALSVAFASKGLVCSSARGCGVPEARGGDKRALAIWVRARPAAREEEEEAAAEGEGGLAWLKGEGERVL